MDYFSYDRATLIRLWFMMFEHFDLINKLNINPKNLGNFLVDVSQKYNRLPFHNMTHAFNVTHITFYILSQLQKE